MVGRGRGSTREIARKRRRPITKRTVSPVTYPRRPRTGCIRPGIRRLGDRHRLPSEVSEKPNQEDDHVAGNGNVESAWRTSLHADTGNRLSHLYPRGRKEQEGGPRTA